MNKFLVLDFITFGILLEASFFIIPYSPYLLLNLYTYRNKKTPAVNTNPTQIKAFIPVIYIMENSIISPIIPPPRYQIH
jgi:hypothetical protein